jgi:hypothetical protein
MIFPAASSPAGPIEGAGVSSSLDGTVYIAAHADYGELGVLVETTSTSDSGVAVEGTGMAFMQDSWTIGGGTPGGAGTVRILISADASYDFVWSDYLGLYVGTAWPGGSPAQVLSLECRTDTGCSPGGGSPYSGTGVLQLSFTFGTPFDVILSLIGSSGARNNQYQEVDAWASARITGIEVLDAAGNPVPGFSLSAESGHDYLAADETVPEPATWGLFGLAAVAFALRRKSYWRGMA